MAGVANDFAGTSAGGLSGNTLTIGSVNISSLTNGLLRLGVSQWSATDRVPAATLQDASSNVLGTLSFFDAATIAEGGGSGMRRASLLYLLAPPAVTGGKVVVTWPGTVDEFVGGCDSWGGVDQTTPLVLLGTTPKHTGATGTTSTVSGVVATGDAVCDVFSMDANGASPTAVANQTSRWRKIAASNTTEGDGQSAFGAGVSINMTWNSFASGLTFAHIGASIKAAAAGGATDPFLARELLTYAARQRAAAW